jgi:hypothetical protein
MRWWRIMPACACQADLTLCLGGCRWVHSYSSDIRRGTDQALSTVLPRDRALPDLPVSWAGIVAGNADPVPAAP